MSPASLVRPASLNHAAAKRSVAVVLVGSLVGCGSTASITRTDGTVDEVAIVRSDPSALYVRYEGGPSDPVRIDRSNVSDIDHPGNVAIVVAAPFLAELALLMSGRAFRSELINGPRGDTSGAALPLTLIFGLPGAGLLGSGLYRYLTSKRAARSFEHAH